MLVSSSRISGAALLLLTSLATLPLSLRAQQSFTLAECIARASQRNVQLQQADLTRRQAVIAQENAQKAWLPEVMASGSQSVSFGRGLSANNTYTTRTTSQSALHVSASMPIFTGFRIRHEEQRAALNLAATLADVDRLRENLSLQVAQAYYQVLYQQDLLTQAQRNRDLQRAQQQRVRSAIEAGKRPAVELADLSARLSQEDYNVTQADNALHLAKLELSQLLELSTPDSIGVLPAPKAATPTLEGLPESFVAALAQRPAITAARLRISAAREGIAVAKSSALPQVSLQVGLGTNYYHTSGFENSPFARQLRDNFGRSASLSVSFPLFDRHQSRNAVRSAQLSLLQQELSLAETEKTLYKEMQNAFYNAKAAASKFTAAQRNEEAAIAAYEAIARKFEFGRANATELDEALNRQRSASTDRITAYYDLIFRHKILAFYRGASLTEE